MDEIPAPVSTPSEAKANDGSKHIRAWAIWLTVGALGVGAFALRSRGTENGPQARADAPHAAQAATQSLPKFIDLGSDRCRSCQAMIPVIAELRRDYGEHLDVSFIDVWDEPSEGQRYGVRTIPTQILFDPEGHELERHVGFWPVAEVIARLEAYGYAMPAPTPTPPSRADGAQ